jgi:hypothetical protein
MIILYLIIPAMLLVLWLLARKTEIPEGINEKGISRELFKMSLFIYQRMQKSRRFILYAPETVRTNLSMLNNPKDFEKTQMEYYVRKISMAILLIGAGSIIATLLHFGAMQSSILDDEGNLLRKSYGEGDYEAELLAKDSNGELIGKISIPVFERKYTKEEVKELFDLASEQLPEAILGSNESLDRVTEDLELVEALPDYPFDISWKLDDYEVMHYDGSLITEAIPEAGQVIMLTATYGYEDSYFEQVLYANVCPRTLSGPEQLIFSLKEKIKAADEGSVYDERIALPSDIGDRSIVWRENTEDNSLIFLILMVILGAASYVIKDRELQKKVSDRRQELLLEYPQFVSKLVLYMGAGMTMRNIIEKLASEYVLQKKAGQKASALYEEVLRSSRELKAGTPEGKVYERLGQRCGSQQYSRLCTLLSQNLKKGNSELLAILQEEAEKTFSDRLDHVRKAGEEAGTKLLMPMILMLMIVMVIIMIPAYMAF